MLIQPLLEKLIEQSPLVLGCGATFLILVYAVFTSIYRIFWHPYAKYPGPLLGKLTSWWASYLAYRGDMHIKMKMYHDKYGTIVRFAPDRLTINTRTALTTIYKSREVQKSKVYKTWVANDGTWHVINAIDKGIHARKNKQMRQVMHPEKLKFYETLWLKHIDELIASLSTTIREEDTSEWTEPRNLRIYVDRMMIDIMGKIGFGRELECQVANKYDYLPGVVAGTAKWNSVNVQSTSLAEFHLGELLYPQQIFFKHKSWEQVIAYVKQRLTTKSQPSSMFGDMIDIQEREHGEKLPINEIWVDATVLISGLSDQVGSAISIIIFYLSRNPKAYDRLRQEIRTKFTETAMIRSGPLMDSCTYLNAVFKESLRMSPTTGGALWREVISDGFQVDGEVIPRGLDVAVPIYALHHHEEYFPDSYSFIPERWLGEHTPTDLALAESVWSPFSVGTRSCVAQNLVTMEVKDIISKLIWTTDFKIVDDQDLRAVGEGKPGKNDGRHRATEFQMKDHITGQYDGPFLQFRQRGKEHHS